MEYPSKIENNKKKIYSLSKPPTPKNPYLHAFRHSSIIKHFQKEGNACHTLNSGGEVDFYLLLASEDEIDELPADNEEFGLITHKKNRIELEIYYNDEIKGIFCFDLLNPMDLHNLNCLLEKRRVNIYYINCFEDEFICAGIKTVYLPGMLCYDIERYMEGKSTLLLPEFSNTCVTDDSIPEEALTQKAWGFYLDFTALLRRVGSMEESEEIVTRHILHAISRLERSRHQGIKGNWFLFWVGRSIGVNEQNIPCEYYSIYLTGQHMTGEKGKDAAYRIIVESLQEIPEYTRAQWVSPLAEEGVPLAVVHDNQLYRLSLSPKFYSRCHALFQEHYLPHPEYKSYYHKIMVSCKNGQSQTKVYDFLEKKRKAISACQDNLTSEEILYLAKHGREDDLPKVFQHLERVKPKDIDELLVSLCEKYKHRIEPYLLPYLSSEQQSLKAVAILGLGMIESKKAIPLLIENIKGTRREASLAKYALALIGQESLPHIVQLLQDSKAEIRIRGIETLALLGTPLAYQALCEMETDRSKRVETVKKRIMEKFNN